MLRALAIGCVVWLGWAPLGAMAGPRPLDSTIMSDDEVVLISQVGDRTLRFTVRREGRLHNRNLFVPRLPAEARIREVRASSFRDGLVLGLAVQSGETTSYYYMCTMGDVMACEVAPHDRPRLYDSWVLSVPLFSSTGQPYRIVDVWNPGGDSVELTFRRGMLGGVQVGGPPVVDERIFHDKCPPFPGLVARKTGLVSVSELDLVPPN